MNGKNGKQSDYPEIALVPYPVIVAASKGDPDAMKIVLQHFSGYRAVLEKINYASLWITANWNTFKTETAA